jgi:hypothetical protein
MPHKCVFVFFFFVDPDAKYDPSNLLKDYINEKDQFIVGSKELGSNKSTANDLLKVALNSVKNWYHR